MKIISSHALREEGDHTCMSALHSCNMSIHALREEGDARGLMTAKS